MKHTYQTNDPKGWGGDPRRGAALGRPSIHADPTFDGAISLRRVYLTEGYDINGTYFGDGDPIYWYHNAEGSIDATLRASGRAAAREEVLKQYPHAKVRR